MLSAIACLTPYSDYNQSPRNMYQCQVSNPKVLMSLIEISHHDMDEILPQVVLNK